MGTLKIDTGLVHREIKHLSFWGRRGGNWLVKNNAGNEVLCVMTHSEKPRTFIYKFRFTISFSVFKYVSDSNNN
jgi:hypothetical protein